MDIVDRYLKVSHYGQLFIGIIPINNLLQGEIGQVFNLYEFIVVSEWYFHLKPHAYAGTEIFTNTPG